MVQPINHFEYLKKIDGNFKPSNQNLTARQIGNTILKVKTSLEDLQGLRVSSMEFMQEDSAQYMAGFMGNLNRKEMVAAYKQWVIDNLIHDPKTGQKRTNEEYAQRASQKSNPVVTLHPTWFAPKTREKALHQRFNHLAGNKKFGRFTKSNLKKTAPHSYTKPTLDEESEAGFEFLLNTEEGRYLTEMVHIELAAEYYPDTYHLYTYSTGATGDWGELDYDGREDISPFRSFAKRFRLKTRRFKEIDIPRWNDILNDLEHLNVSTEISDLIQRLERTLELENEFDEQLKHYDPDKDKTKEDIQNIDDRIRSTTEKRVTSAKKEIVPLIVTLIANPEVPKKTRNKLIQMRGMYETRGLMYAQPHSRINSKKIKTALQSIGIPADGSMTVDSEDITLVPMLRKLIKKLGEEGPLNNDLFALALKPKSAIEQLMLHGLGAEYIDEGQVGFQLIADTQNKLVILAMVYFASQFGVLEHTNLMPLIEEHVGQKNAKRIFKSLAKDEEFGKNIELTKIMAMLSGLSDITRQQGLFAPLHQEKAVVEFLQQVKEYPNDVVFYIYPCGGSDVNRSRHVGSLDLELEHSLYPFAVHMAEKMGVAHRVRFMIAEQGQSAFFKYSSEEAGAKSIMGHTMYMNQDHSWVENDPLYSKENRRITYAIAETVFERTQRVQTDPDFHEALNVEKNDNPAGGSRPLGHVIRLMMRAIGQSNTSQRMGACISALYGLNHARRLYPDQFEQYIKESQTFKRFMQVADIALDKTNTQTFIDNIEMYNPARYHEKSRNYSLHTIEQKAYRKLAVALEKKGYYDRFSKFAQDIKNQIDDWTEYRAQFNDIMPPLEGLAYQKSLKRNFTEKICQGAKMALTEQKWLQWFTIPQHGAPTPKRSDLDKLFLSGDSDAIRLMNAVFDTDDLDHIVTINERYEQTLQQAANDNFGYHKIQKKIDWINKIDQEIVRFSEVSNHTPAGYG